MRDEDKTREQLLSELSDARRQLAELKSLEAAQARAARMLREIEERYNRLFDNLPTALFRATPAGELLDANLAMADMLSYSDAGTLLSLHLNDIYLDPDQLREDLEEAAQRGNGSDSERQLRRHDGGVVSVRSRIYLVRDEDDDPLYYEGSLVAIVGQSLDGHEPAFTTQRLEGTHRIIDALGRLEAPAQIARMVLKQICDLVPCWRAGVTLFEIDQRDHIALAESRRDESGPRMTISFPIDWFGTDVDTLRRGDILRVDDMEAISEPSQVIQILREAGMRSFASAPLVMRGELIGTLNLSAELPGTFSHEVIEAAGEMASLLAISVHGAELLEQARSGSERVKLLSGRLLEVQEEERRRIARELHDEIGQSLTGLKLALETVIPADYAETHLQSAQELAGELLTKVRELSLDLRPAMLDDLGLVPALLWQLDRYTTQTGVEVSFTQEGLDARFRPELETAAYRIVQEALTNVARHADVSVAWVSLWLEEEILVVRIEDKGRGFDVAAYQAGSASRGLAGMRERAALLGGELEITSSMESGTSVVARLPVQEAGSRWVSSDSM